MSDQAYFDSDEIKKKMQNQQQNSNPSWTPSAPDAQVKSNLQRSIMGSHGIIIPPDERTEGKNMPISREELDAKLGQNKAEVQAIASGMREDMSAWRETQNTKMDQISATLTAMSAKIDSVDRSLNGQIDGLKSSYSAIKWMLGIILTVLALVFAIPQVQSYLNLSEPAKQPQPTVIYVQQPPAQQSK